MTDQPRSLFVRLYEDYAPTMIGVLKRSLGRARAEEHVHDVFLRAWMTPPGQGLEEHTKGLLWRMSRQILWKEAQRAGDRAAGDLDPLVETLPGAQPSPGRQMDLEDLTTRTRAALAEEDAIDRYVVEQRLLDQPFANIAHSLATTVDAVTARYHRTTARVRDRCVEVEAALAAGAGRGHYGGSVALMLVDRAGAEQQLHATASRIRWDADGEITTQLQLPALASAPVWGFARIGPQNPALASLPFACTFADERLAVRAFVGPPAQTGMTGALEVPADDVRLVLFA